MRTSTKSLWAAIVLALAGCNRDAGVLDRLSRLYSSFLNTDGDATVASYVPLISDNPNNQFWVHLKAALNSNASNAARVQSASACIAAYDSAVSPYLDRFSEEVQTLDKTVLELIETANAIHSREYRNDAVELARSAREEQINVAAVYQLLVARFSVQRKMMEIIVGNGGSILALFASYPEASNDVKRMSKEIDERRKSITTSQQKCRDAFSALKGKASLTGYPTRYDN